MRRAGQPPKASKSKPLSRNILAYFFLFTVLNAVLAYAPLPGWPKILLGLAGFAALGGFYLKTLRPGLPGETPLYQREFFTPSAWLVGAVLILALAARLYKLTSYLSYPTSEEFMFAYNAIHLNDQWTWNPFFFVNGSPPLYFWILSLFLRVFGVTFRNIWLLPAVFSFLTVVFYFLAARRFFSRSFSFSCLLLLSFSFWPVFAGRFSINASWMVFWQAVTFWVLAETVRAASAGNPRGWSAGLGLCAGIGLYVYFPWVLVALFLALTVGMGSFRGGRRSGAGFYWFAGGFLLAALPLLAAALKTGFGSYCSILPALDGNEEASPWPLAKHFLTFTDLLWEGWSPTFEYLSHGGGFLNPLLGGLFFLGAFELWRFRRGPFPLWMASAFAVMFLPNLLLNTDHGYRLAPLLPIFLTAVALGFWVVYSSLRGRVLRAVFIPGLFFLSLFLDAANMAKTMAMQQSETDKGFGTILNNCGFIRNLSQKYAPGRVYCDFLTDYWNSCYLTVATFPYNALRNPSVPPERAAWAALVTDEWSFPILTKSFTGVQFIRTSPDRPKAPYDTLAVIPMNPANRKALEGWKEADAVFRESDFRFFNHPYQKPYGDLIGYLRDHARVSGSSPFLGVYYWMKLGWLHFMDKNNPEALRCFQKAAKIAGAKGAWTAHMGAASFPVPAWTEGLETSTNIGGSSKF